MRVGIALHDWKLPIFERHLSQAGYAYKKGAGLTADTFFLYVETDDAMALKKVVVAAQKEAAASRHTQ
jgi:hypothetical protein